MLKLRLLVSLAALAIPHLVSAQGSYYHCSQRVGLPRARNSSYYFTKIYPMGSATMPDIIAAWQKYAAANQNPEVSSAECYTGTESNLRQVQAGQAQIWGGGKVVESDWQYSASMIANPSKQGVAYSFCLSGDFAGNTVYDTPVFEMPLAEARSTRSPAEVTFTKYIIRKYGLKQPWTNWYTGSVGCPHSWASKQDAIDGLAKAEAKLRAQKKSIVHTGWLYVRNADTPPLESVQESH